MSGTTEAVAKAIYEGRNGKGCTPWSRQPGAHREPYLKDARAALLALSPGDRWDRESGQSMMIAIAWKEWMCLTAEERHKAHADKLLAHPEARAKLRRRSVEPPPSP